MTHPTALKYAATHEWVKSESSGELTVGITDHAQDLLGDIVFADLPQLDQHFSAADPCMVLESVKAASDIHMPVNGTISEINVALEDTPEMVNEDPFGQGWLFKIRPDNVSDVDTLLTAQGYASTLDE